MRASEPIGYRHEAQLCSGTEEFFRTSLEFINDGLVRGNAILIVLDEEKADALRSELGPDAGAVGFADTADLGRNPAHLLGLWHTFVTEYDGVNVGLRGLCEAVTADRSAAELAECHLDEARLNLAFAGHPDFWLRCAYDRDALDGDVLAEAFRNHPYIASGPYSWRSDYYEEPDLARLLGGRLPDPPKPSMSISFGREDLAVVRRFVSDLTERLNFVPMQASEVLAAISEVAANAVQHGGCRASLRMWVEENTIFFEVSDHGRFEQLLAGRLLPDVTTAGGRGLWIANQFCDLLQIRSTPTGTLVRGQITRVGP